MERGVSLAHVRAVLAIDDRVDGVLERTVARLPFARSPSAVLGLRMLRGFEQCERQGDRPGFEITDELKQAWGIRIS